MLSTAIDMLKKLLFYTLMLLLIYVLSRLYVDYVGQAQLPGIELPQRLPSTF